MSDETNDDFSQFARRAVSESARPTPPPPAQETVTPVAPVSPPPVELVDSGCLIAGPISSGKSAFLSVLWDACVQSNDSDLSLSVSFDEASADLIQTRDMKRQVRKGLEASASNAEYQFTIAAKRRNLRRDREDQPLGEQSFTYVDGPGGALFTNELNPEALPRDMQNFRQKLLAAGQSASSLVIFMNVMSSETNALVVGNLPRILSDLSIKMNVPVGSFDGDWEDRSFLGGLFERWRTAPPSAQTPPRMTQTRRLNADRVLFVFNFVDQLCVHWRNQWLADKDPRATLTPLEIAHQYAHPLEIGFGLLGSQLFRKVQGFLKPSAKLAIALCSCGGFDTESGDPYLDTRGLPNMPLGFDPSSRTQHTTYYGVREAILYAGFGIPTPDIVEEVTQDHLDEN